MAQYMLLLYDDPEDWKKFSPEEMQQAIGKYMGWQQKVIDGKRLADDVGKVVRPQKNGKPRATDGPYSETKEILGGFYLIEAPDYEQAVAIAMTHPHLEFGGTIEVRALWAM